MHRESNREDIELNINTAFVSFTRFSEYILALMIIIYTYHFCKSVFVNEIDNECLSQAVMLVLSTAASATCWWGRLTADGDHASAIYCFPCSSRMFCVEFSVEFLTTEFV